MRQFIYQLLFRYHFRFGYDFRFDQPGLEVKFACEEAEKLGVPIHFLGPELNRATW